MNLFLLLTILSESAAIILMKYADGFTNKLYSILAVIFYGLSFFFLTKALRTLPAGIANALWAGGSVVLVAIAGVVFFKEHLSLLQIICVVMIVAGIAGLQLNG